MPPLHMGRGNDAFITDQLALGIICTSYSPAISSIYKLEVVVAVQTLKYAPKYKGPGLAEGWYENTNRL